MRSPVLRSTTSSETQNWVTRVRENLAQLIAPTGLTPSCSNGAPIHLLKLDGTGKSGSAQTASLVMHAGIVAALLFVAVSAPIHRDGPRLYPPPYTPLRFTTPPEGTSASLSAGRKGGGGDDNPVPATHGFFPPHSSVQLVAPRLPDNLNHPLPVSVTIFDAQAAPEVAPISNVGLPWMPADTNSGGPGRHGIGAGDDGGMGDLNGSGVGDDGDRPPGHGIAAPICVVCPLPVYTDEARHVKMQGTVTLRVLVSADGRAAQVRIVRGVGYGLDERAIETVRGWIFAPAHDAARHNVSTWVTIEAVFRLF